jgi:hypothetical protein
MRIIRCKTSLTVTLSGGRIIQVNNCDDETYKKVEALYAADDEFEMINLLIPEKPETEGINTVRLIKFWKDQEQSSELTREGNSVYWNGVSPLSMPMSFAEKVMKAEKNGDTAKMEAYRNFWTLLSLNPDPAVRENLFKFLEKWGMVITKSGLFVGYRNVAHKSGESPDVFTDEHKASKILHNGQIFILRGDKTYTIDGRLVK